MKMLLVLAAAIIAMFAIVDTMAPTPAAARWIDRPNAGYCPAGTCNKIGGWRALNVRNCSPAYCRR